MRVIHDFPWPAPDTRGYTRQTAKTTMDNMTDQWLLAAMARSQVSDLKDAKMMGELTSGEALQLQGLTLFLEGVDHTTDFYDDSGLP